MVQGFLQCLTHLRLFSSYSLFAISVHTFFNNKDSSTFSARLTVEMCCFFELTETLVKRFKHHINIDL